MEFQTRKLQIIQEKAKNAAQDMQEQISASYRQGYCDGSANERRIMTDDLRDMLNGFSLKCEARARAQENELNSVEDPSNPDSVQGDDEREPGALNKIAAKFAPARVPNVAEMQDAGDHPEGSDDKPSPARKAG